MLPCVKALVVGGETVQLRLCRLNSVCVWLGVGGRRVGLGARTWRHVCVCVCVCVCVSYTYECMCLSSVPLFSIVILVYKQ